MALIWPRPRREGRRRDDPRFIVLDQPRLHLGSTSPPEFGKTRPGLIVSSTAHNEVLDSVVVVPLSTIGDEIRPLRIRTDNVRGKAAFAVLPGIRQVSKARLAGFIGVASSPFMTRLDAAIALYLGD